MPFVRHLRVLYKDCDRLPSRDAIRSMRFHNIQILRFVAAAGVLLYHSHYYVGAYLWNTPLIRMFDVRLSWGVMLFFAISGFVVSHSLTFTKPGRFLVLRLMRIYPAFWLAAAIVVIGRQVLGGHPLGPGLAPALTLMPFGGAQYPLGVEWSLVYEIFFYTLLAVVACMRVRHAIEWSMLAWVVAIAAMATFGPFRATSFFPTFGTIAFSTFNLPFIAGVLAYSWFRRVDRLPIAILGAAIPIALFAAGRAGVGEVQFAFQAVGFGALVLLVAEVSRRRDASPANPLVRAGDWSYGLYLLHVPVIVAILALVPFSPKRADLVFVLVAGVALVVGCTFGWLETRLYRANRARVDRRCPKSRVDRVAGR